MERVGGTGTLEAAVNPEVERGLLEAEMIEGEEGRLLEVTEGLASSETVDERPSGEGCWAVYELKGKTVEFDGKIKMSELEGRMVELDGRTVELKGTLEELEGRMVKVSTRELTVVSWSAAEAEWDGDEVDGRLEVRGGEGLKTKLVGGRSTLEDSIEGISEEWGRDVGAREGEGMGASVGEIEGEGGRGVRGNEAEGMEEEEEGS